MSTAPSTFQQQLKDAQDTIKVLDAEQQKLLREASVEEHKVHEAQAKLIELGIEAPEKLSVQELVALRDTIQADMEQNLITVQTKIAEANAVLAEYNATVQA